jgi:hypothetical protein
MGVRDVGEGAISFENLLRPPREEFNVFLGLLSKHRCVVEQLLEFAAFI